MTELFSFAVLVALTTGSVEVFKRALELKGRYLPLAALVFGFLLMIVANSFQLTSFNILIGIAVGLSAAGLFDQTKLFKTN